MNWDHVRPGHAEWVRFREVMTADVNAAISGAYGAGAEAVFVSDGHWNAANILREQLDARAWLNSGAPLPLSKMQGIDSGVDGVMFVGYHARAGAHRAVLDHTWSDSVLGVWLNGQFVGELGLDAALAGHYSVSVIMLSGGQSAGKEVQELVGHDVEVAMVKKARGASQPI